MKTKNKTKSVDVTYRSLERLATEARAMTDARGSSDRAEKLQLLLNDCRQPCSASHGHMISIKAHDGKFLLPSERAINGAWLCMVKRRRTQWCFRSVIKTFGNQGSPSDSPIGFAFCLCHICQRVSVGRAIEQHLWDTVTARWLILSQTRRVCAAIRLCCMRA